MVAPPVVPAVNRAPVPVLYIGGTGRSGSTLVARVLGSVPSVCSAGELRFAWQRGFVEDRACGCGEPVRSCPFWGAVVADHLGVVPDRATAAARHERIAALTRMRTLPGWLRGSPPAGAAAVAADLGQLVRHVADHADASVVVDSSKLPTHAALLALSADVDLRVVHLLRDPRATAWSWQRTRATGQVQGHDEPMDTFSATKASLLWSVWNASLPRLVPPERLLTVRYEDLMADPRRAFERMLAFAGLPDAQVPFVADDTIDVAASHTVAGNPGRLRHGPTQLRSDAEWRHALPARDRRTVSALTAPVRRRHGYR